MGRAIGIRRFADKPGRANFARAPTAAPVFDRQRGVDPCSLGLIEHPQYRRRHDRQPDVHQELGALFQEIVNGLDEMNLEHNFRIEQRPPTPRPSDTFQTFAGIEKTKLSPHRFIPRSHYFATCDPSGVLAILVCI